MKQTSFYSTLCFLQYQSLNNYTVNEHLKNLPNIVLNNHNETEEYPKARATASRSSLYFS